MIEINGISKSFGEINALKNINAKIEDGHVFGLIGTNGAGKSTLLRCIAGIFKPDAGTITVDEEPVYENPSAKAKIFYVSDDQYFLPGSTPKEMLVNYKTFYPDFDIERFHEFMNILKLEETRKISTFSKGMKKQLSIAFGICANTKYLLCDETFDGLDPVIRQAVKKLFVKEVDSRDFTPIIASHNLRELEDVCEHVGLLHEGGILFTRDLDEMKLGMYKLQCVFSNTTDEEVLKNNFTIMQRHQRGSLITITLKGQKDRITNVMATINPIFWELLPLTLEEIFISETEVLGYDFENLTK